MMRDPSHKAFPANLGFWLWCSVAAALLAVLGNVIALSVSSIYAGLTPAFLPQALAQDLANLIVVAPLGLVLAVLTWRGSLRAFILWLGVLAFCAYNYVIYTFSIPFGPLFLLWVAVLGLTLFTLIAGITAADHRVIESCFPLRHAIQVVAWTLIITALIFAWLWLSEDVPALLSGARPRSLIDMALPTNPVHILDLGFFLPAAVYTGVLLLRRRSFAFTLAPAFLLFLILTGLPILLTPFVQAARGRTAAWGVVPPIGILVLGLLVELAWLLSTSVPLKQPREAPRP